MRTITARISSKYQIVVPKFVREALDLRPQDTVLFLVDGDTVILSYHLSNHPHYAPLTNVVLERV